MTNIPIRSGDDLSLTLDERASLQVFGPKLNIPTDGSVLPSLDSVYTALSGFGWHILRLDGYDPALGGPPNFVVQGVDPAGGLRLTGHGSTLRAAFYDLAARVFA